MPRLGRLVVGASMIDPTGSGYPWANSLVFTHLTTYSFDGEPDPPFVLAASYHYGRDRFIQGDFETGLATVVLNNDTGEFSPESSVLTAGDHKLKPGMWMVLSYTLEHSVYEDALEIVEYLRDATGDATWTSSTVPNVGDLFYKGAERPTVNAETWVGHVDGCDWTLHGADSDLRAGWWRDLFLNGEYGLGTTGNTRFLGRIYSMEDQYDEGGFGSVTVVTLVDGLADMSVHTKQLGAPRAAELTSTRFPFLYDGVEAPFSSASDTGIFTVEAGDLPNNRLAEGRALALAEGGAIYAGHGSHAGEVVFRNANWLITSPRAATVQAVLGTGRIGITAATTKYSISRVFNDINYENSAITATATNAASVDEYSKRTITKTVLNNDNTDLQAIANRDLALLKDLQFSIDSVTIKPENVFEVLFALQVAVGDRLEVTVDVNDFEYTQTLFVAGVSESWTAASNDWTLTLRLDSRDGDTVLT